jgi:hypothetical protein
VEFDFDWHVAIDAASVMFLYAVSVSNMKIKMDKEHGTSDMPHGERKLPLSRPHAMHIVLVRLRLRCLFPAAIMLRDLAASYFS